MSRQQSQPRVAVTFPSTGSGIGILSAEAMSMGSTGTQVEEKKINSQSENRRGGKLEKDKEGEVR